MSTGIFYPILKCFLHITIGCWLTGSLYIAVEQNDSFSIKGKEFPRKHTGINSPYFPYPLIIMTFFDIAAT